MFATVGLEPGITLAAPKLHDKIKSHLFGSAPMSCVQLTPLPTTTLVVV